MLYHHTRQHVIFADPKTAAFWYPNVQHGGPLAGLLVELVREKDACCGDAACKAVHEFNSSSLRRRAHVGYAAD